MHLSSETTPRITWRFTIRFAILKKYSIECENLDYGTMQTKTCNVSRYVHYLATEITFTSCWKRLSYRVDRDLKVVNKPSNPKEPHQRRASMGENIHSIPWGICEQSFQIQQRTCTIRWWSLPPEDATSASASGFFKTVSGRWLQCNTCTLPSVHRLFRTLHEKFPSRADIANPGRYPGPVTSILALPGTDCHLNNKFQLIVFETFGFSSHKMILRTKASE